MRALFDRVPSMFSLRPPLDEVTSDEGDEAPAKTPDSKLLYPAFFE
jgi:hypothetical protein